MVVQPRLIIFADRRIQIEGRYGMDLRMVKTRRQIKDAFLKLRERHMPEKIKVKDICDLAQINKTTFYNHYTDSMELSNEIDEHAIDKILSAFPTREQLLADPKAYMTELLQTLERESAHLKTVFRGKHDVLCAELEERLYRLCSGLTDGFENQICLSFSIGGFVRVVKDYLFADTKYNVEQVAEHSAQMVDALIQNRRRSKKTIS
jgi:AcrR family transcriptional regulator